MKLALFFTRNTSLKDWVDSGLFYREKMIYEQHLATGKLEEVFWLTYGCCDQEVAKDLYAQGKLDRRIKVLDMPWFFRGKIGMLIYSFLLPFIKLSAIRDCEIFKTNQMDGAWAALISGLVFPGKFYLRTGYTLSIFLMKQERSFFKIHLYKLIECICYKFADISVVSSRYDREYVLTNYRPLNNVEVLYNYIDTSRFVDEGLERKEEFIFVGRLNKQKNLYNTIEALVELGQKLTVVGDGELGDDLKSRYGETVNFLGKVSNDRVSKLLNEYKYYILCSHYEGMPKTLIEAMANGCIAVGTNVLGINELINNETGFLAVSDRQEDILKALSRALGCNNESNVVSAAKSFIENNFSLLKVSEREAGILSL